MNQTNNNQDNNVLILFLSLSKIITDLVLNSAKNNLTIVKEIGIIILKYRTCMCTGRNGIDYELLD